jgi:hypothetical protein
MKARRCSWRKRCTILHSNMLLDEVLLEMFDFCAYEAQTSDEGRKLFIKKRNALSCAVISINVLPNEALLEMHI